MTFRPSRSLLRDPHGLSSVELAISAVCLVIMVLLAIDLAMMMLGNQILDRAARDATRAAAAQSTQTSAINAAKTALAMHQTDGHFVSQPVLTSTISPDFVYNDYSGTPYGQVIPPGNPNSGSVALNPTVTVTTKVQVLLPASMGFFGVSLDQGALTGGKMTFVRTYTFPIVRQSLNKTYE